MGGAGGRERVGNGQTDTLTAACDDYDLAGCGEGGKGGRDGCVWLFVVGRGE